MLRKTGKLEGTCRRLEEAENAPGIAHADLNVIKAAEGGGGIDGLAFIQEAWHGVEGWKSGAGGAVMEVVDHRTVEETGFGLGSFVAQGFDTTFGAPLHVVLVGRCDEFRAFGIGEVKAMAEVDQRADDGGFLDLAVRNLRHLLCPVQGACLAAFPEVDAVAEPVPGIGAGAEMAAVENHPGDGFIATVVAKDDLGWKHQRNFFFALPVLGSCIPVAASISRAVLRLRGKRAIASLITADMDL
jgi:hypothetical protein